MGTAEPLAHVMKTMMDAASTIVRKSIEERGGTTPFLAFVWNVIPIRVFAIVSKPGAVATTAALLLI